MKKNCCGESQQISELAKAHSKVLWTVLYINSIMFVFELGASFFANSVALMGDSLDMLGDALAYGSSLLVVSSSISAKIRVAKFKGILMIITGLAVLLAAIVRSFLGDIPEWNLMTIVGFVVLGANACCLYLLWQYRNDDINFSSVWACSRNDVIANIAVLFAAGLVFLSKSQWPDLLIGFGISVLFIRSAISVLKEAALSKMPN